MSDKEVSIEEIQQLENNKSVLLIDVREPKELNETGSIPGSINIPVGKLEDVFEGCSPEEYKTIYCREKPNCDTPIVLYCRSGNRSATALNKLITLGYQNVKHYPGGWLQWEKQILKK